MHSAVRAHEAASTVEWDAEIGRRGRALEDRAGRVDRRLVGAAEGGALALVVGAGVSRSCGLPLWSELVDDVATRLLTRQELLAEEADGLLRAVKFRDDPVLLAQALTSMTAESDVQREVGRALDEEAARDSELLNGLCDLIGRLWTTRRPGTPLVVLTFNYDTLVERRLASMDLPVATHGRSSTYSRLSRARINVWHVHGVVTDDERFRTDEPIVLTEASYADAYLSRRSDPLSAILRRGALPLFVGFSFRDFYVRQVLIRAARSASEPVAVGLVPDESVIVPGQHDSLLTRDAIIERLDASEDPSHNKRAGAARKAAIRETAINDIPAWFARWVFDCIGVEWLRVASRHELAGVLRSLTERI